MEVACLAEGGWEKAFSLVVGFGVWQSGNGSEEQGERHHRARGRSVESSLVGAADGDRGSELILLEEGETETRTAVG
ncbi:hypothetical protein TIFTF001_014022 [Ficus carica]|uniref:Uncharacterized protein n=1 Tax=Ficus carica TaxID=3494 RepID=A0AA88D6K9_FICCA|nr:hypothetical protein TIFTF001_014022 [Ficus carica]